MTMRHVYVVEDDEPVRHAFQLMLQLLELPRRPSNRGRLSFQAPAISPRGCVPLDIRMPEIDGLKSGHCLRAAWPQKHCYEAGAGSGRDRIIESADIRHAGSQFHDGGPAPRLCSCARNRVFLGYLRRETSVAVRYRRPLQRRVPHNVGSHWFQRSSAHPPGRG